MNTTDFSGLKRSIHPMPDFIERALLESNLMEAYRKRPPYQQNDYIGWITGARREVTIRKRLEQMLDELEQGNVYMKMEWKSRQRSLQSE